MSGASLRSPEQREKITPVMPLNPTFHYHLAIILTTVEPSTFRRALASYTITSATDCITKIENIPGFLLLQQAYQPNGKPQYPYLDDCTGHWCHGGSLGSG